MRSPHSNQDRRSISLKLTARSGGSGVELCGHEDGAGIGVGEQVITRLVVQEEVIAVCPIQHLLATAAQDGDIEGFDLDLFKHLCGTSGWCGSESYLVLYHGVGFAFKALQGPGATFFDVDRYCRQGYDPSDVGGIALVGEAGQVVFDAVVPGDKGGGPRQVNISVGSDQPAARECG